MANCAGEVGKSRKISLALPVSIQFFLISGRVFSAKSAQCGQVSEAYSMMVIGASALPIISSIGQGLSVAAEAWLPKPSRPENISDNRNFRTTDLQKITGGILGTLFAGRKPSSEAGERFAHLFVFDFGQALLQRLLLVGRQDRRGRGFLPGRTRRNMALGDSEIGHGAIAE